MGRPRSTARPGELADTFSCPATPPADWEPVFVLEDRQMIWSGSGGPEHAQAEPGAGVVELGAGSVPA